MVGVNVFTGKLEQSQDMKVFDNLGSK
jgi:T-complex protein 1 subunit theta